MDKFDVNIAPAVPAKKEQANRFFSLSTNDGTIEKPCSLLAKFFVGIDRRGDDLGKFIAMFDDIDTEEKTEQAIERFLTTYDCSDYIANIRAKKDKERTERERQIVTLHQRFHNLKVNKVEKITVMSQTLWVSEFVQRDRAKRLDKIRNKGNQNPDAFNSAYQRIKCIYGFSDEDMEKIRYFVERVKAFDGVLPSYNRMLYIWSAKKGTGKTTIASMLVSILNGEDKWNSGTTFHSSLAVEMQHDKFAIPLVHKFACAQLDECFYRDMRKSYAKFKNMMTTKDGSTEIKFGGIVSWFGMRNYIATSNEPIKRFIQDVNDRRFLVINMENTPAEDYSTRMDVLFSIWKDFVYNSTPAKPIEQWYNDFGIEEGDKQDNIDAVKLYFHTTEFKNLVQGICDGANLWNRRGTIDARKGITWFVTQAKQRPECKDVEKDEVRQAVKECFGECYETKTKTSSEKNCTWSLVDVWNIIHEWEKPEK